MYGLEMYRRLNLERLRRMENDVLDDLQLKMQTSVFMLMTTQHVLPEIGQRLGSMHDS